MFSRRNSVTLSSKIHSAKKWGEGAITFDLVFKQAVNAANFALTGEKNKNTACCFTEGVKGGVGNGFFKTGGFGNRFGEPMGGYVVCATLRGYDRGVHDFGNRGGV